MSYKTQVALGKNTTLQRKLEEKFIEFRRNLKSTRRRLDNLEEECLSMLYKLIVEQSGKDDDGNKNDGGNTDGQRRARSAKLWRGQACVEPPLKPPTDPSDMARRSATSLSVRDYKKSYSFQIDGLNIDKNRRERYIRNKKQKEKKEIEIRRGNVHWATHDDFDERPMTTLPETEAKDENETKQVRPYTADPYQSRNTGTKLLNRSKLRNSLRPGNSTPATEFDNKQGSTESGHDDTTGEILTSDDTEMSRLENNSKPVSEANQRTCRNTPHIAFKVSVTKLNDMRGPTPTVPEFCETPRLPSRTTGAVEDELEPLGEDDQRHLETIMTENTDGDQDSVDGTISRLDMSSRMTTKSGRRSRQAKTPTGDDGNNIQELAVRTQSFLASYAKKSKLLGYVVKSRSSSAATRDKSKKMYRSHCVTHQELVSIKASIKQQESRTRLLVQRSAKLAKYVENLANASKVRKYQQSLKTS